MGNHVHVPCQKIVTETLDLQLCIRTQTIILWPLCSSKSRKTRSCKNMVHFSLISCGLKKNVAIYTSDEMWCDENWRIMLNPIFCFRTKTCNFFMKNSVFDHLKACRHAGFSRTIAIFEILKIWGFWRLIHHEMIAKKKSDWSEIFNFEGFVTLLENGQVVLLNSKKSILSSSLSPAYKNHGFSLIFVESWSL